MVRRLISEIAADPWARGNSTVRFPTRANSVQRDRESTRQPEELLAFGILLLLGIALSNSWQLVVSHESEATPDPDF